MKLVLRDYMKFIFGDGNFSEVGNEHFFLAAGRAQSTGFPPKLQVRGKVEAVHTWWGNKQDERRENIFDKMGNIGGIIQGNNYAGH